MLVLALLVHQEMNQFVNMCFMLKITSMYNIRNNQIIKGKIIESVYKFAMEKGTSLTTEYKHNCVRCF